MRRQRDWQKSDPHLREHPAFRDFCALLDCPPVVAHGLLAGLWAFAFKFAQDGDITRFSARQIATATGWEGNPDKLLEALEEAGFVEQTNRTNRTKSLHDWYEWGGALFAERTYHSRRRWNQRHAKDVDMQEEVSQRVAATNTRVTQCRSDTVRQSATVAPEERREEEIKPLKPLTLLPSPRGDGGRETKHRQKQFDEVFWPDYPNKQGKAQARKKWTRLADEDRARAIFVAKAMAYSVEQGWKDAKLCPYGSTFINQRRWEDWFDEDGQPVVPLDYQRSNGHLQRFFSVITKAGENLDWEGDGCD